jgi:hypothetical protein
VEWKKFAILLQKEVFRKGSRMPGRNFLLKFCGVLDSSELRKAPLQAFKVEFLLKINRD